MFGKLINIIFKLIIMLVNVLLAPIDLAISSLLPDVSSSMASIVSFMQLPFNFMGWIFELLHVPTLALTLIIAYWVFKYGIVTAVAGTRYVIKLYQKFKL